MQAESILNSESPLGSKNQVPPGMAHVREPLSDDLKSALLAIPAGILFVNPLGIVELVNESAVKIFGENLEGACWRNVIRRHFMPQKNDGLEVSLKNERKVKFSISNLPNKPGQLIHITDLTGTRALQSKISHMEKLSALGKMVASLAHQLRTPLSAAILYAMNLNNPNLRKEMQVPFCSKLVARLRDLDSQINDMLLFAKSGKSGVLDNIDLVSFLRKIAIEATELPGADKYHVSFKSSDGKCPIKGNASALKGALNNLLQNAIESGADNIDIQFRHSDTSFDIQISDNGPGIPEQDRQRIFEPFYTTRSQGTGLGLAVVAGVIKSHKGAISVTESHCGGTEFNIMLPACLANESTPFKSKRDDANSQHHRLAGETA